MILVITVLGMAGVLFWGTPTLQGIQDRGSIIGMEGEFDELRRASLELSVPDASRVPSVVLEDGSLDLEQGSRMMISMSRDASNIDCDPELTGWETGPSNTITATLTDCRNGGDLLGLCGLGCLEIHKITGSSTIEQTNMDWSQPVPGVPNYVATWDTTGTEPDFSEDDWVVRLTNGGTTVYASAWVIEQKRITWRLSTSVTDVQLHFEGGAIFEVDAGSYFLHRQAPIREDAFGSEDYVLRLVTLLGSDSGSAGRGTPEVFLGLVGNHVRISTSAAYQVRYTIAGDIAEAWCQSLLLRNAGLTATATTERTYTVDGDCSDATPSVLYEVTDPSSGSIRKSFPLEFLHVRITSSIQV